MINSLISFSIRKLEKYINVHLEKKTLKFYSHFMHDHDHKLFRPNHSSSKF